MCGQRQNVLSRDPGDRRSLPTPELMFYRSQLVVTQVPPAWVQMLADDVMAPDDLGNTRTLHLHFA
jgi:hypothetical protein